MGAGAGSRVPVRSRRPRAGPPAVRLPVPAGYVGRVSLAFPHPTPLPPQFPSPGADPTPLWPPTPGSQGLGTRDGSTTRLPTPRAFAHPPPPGVRALRVPPSVREPCVLSLVLPTCPCAPRAAWRARTRLRAWLGPFRPACLLLLPCAAPAVPPPPPAAHEANPRSICRWRPDRHFPFLTRARKRKGDREGGRNWWPF